MRGSGVAAESHVVIEIQKFKPCHDIQSVRSSLQVDVVEILSGLHIQWGSLFLQQ